MMIMRPLTETTEILDIETLTFSTGPDLPKYMTNHCIVRYNDTHLFIRAGGPYWTGTVTYNPYLVDIRQDPIVLHELTNMKQKSREGAGCAVIDIPFYDSNDKSINQMEKLRRREQS